MACIFKRGKTWSYSVDLGRDETGKRRKKGKGGFRTQKEAKEAAALLEVDIAGGIFVDEKKITFGELAEQWLNEHSKEIKPSTRYIYQFSIDKLNLYFNNALARGITKMYYQKILTELYNKNISQNTLRSINSCANMIFEYACKFDILKSNPAQYAKIPKPKSAFVSAEKEAELPKYLEKDELKLFLRTVKESDNFSNYVTFLTLAYTGMRRGELGALKWDDINFENKTISVSKTLYVENQNIRNYVLLTPKTKTSKRIIPITSNILHELQNLRKNQKVEQMRYRSEWHNGNFVFTAPLVPGYPSDFTTTWRSMRRNLLRAELPANLSPHSLRHTHTSLLAEAGVSLEAIMERLGHADDAITRNIYLHITKDIKKDAAQKFQALMDSANG